MIAVVVADTFKKQEEQAQINAITANMMSHMTLPPTPAPTVATVTTTPAVAAATSATSATSLSPNLIAARLVKMMGAAAANASDR
jgi:hypothetical protein